MRILLICHDGAALDQVGLARWLASFSELVGLVVLQETRRQVLRRIRREIRRVGVLRSSSPNTAEAEQFIKKLRPDLIVARCKFLLMETVFSIPPKGTLLMHPGICPEYRNAHAPAERREA